MITFLRKIRRSLLTESKFSQYLLYAIGEIVLVVIGILIALQINNWNDIEKGEKEEKVYLEALRSEFASNLVKIETAIISCETLTDQLGEILTLFDIEKLRQTPTNQVAISLGKALQYEIQFNPNTGVQKDLISSGNLKQLSNSSLRQQIAAFDTSLEEIKSQESGALTTKRGITNSITKLVSMRLLFTSVGVALSGDSKFKDRDVKLIFQEMEIENNLILYQGITKTTGSVYYSNLKKDIEGIIAIIDSELQQNL